MRTSLPTSSLRDASSIISKTVVPTVAKGPIIRRPKVVALSERLDLDTKAVHRMQRLSDTYGPGPLRGTLNNYDRRFEFGC